MRVSPVSVADLKDLTATRIVVEGEALKRSIAAGDAAWEERVSEAFAVLSGIEPMLADNPRQHVDEWERRNNAFHVALVSACPLRWLMRFNDLLYKQHERYRRLCLMRRTTPRDVLAEHQALHDAAIARDAERAAAVLEDHIARTADMLMSGIQDGSWFGAPIAHPPG